MARGRLTARLLAAALLAVLVPAAPVANAQPDDATDPTPAGPQPPPLGDDRAVPDDDGKPDLTYTRTDEGCVQALDGSVELEDKAWGQDVLQFGELQQFATGAGQTVAVIDTGVNAHDYLAGRLKGGGDYVADGGDGLDDCDGHGTQVAGIIAAKPTSDNIGFRGIAPDATILSIRQSSEYYEFKPPEGSNLPEKPSAGSLKTLAKAVVSAANQGADVINMSVDSCRPATAPITEDERNLQRALRYAVEDQNAVVVSSAGNIPSKDCPDQNSSDPTNPDYIVTPPWFSEYVLSVAAVDKQGNPADFSMHGPWVSVAAPGTEIISLNPGDPRGLVNVTAGAGGQQPSLIRGTSFAAPYVAGLAALVAERFEKLGEPLTAKQIMDRIKATAAHPAAEGGRNVQIGYGMVDPVAALTRMLPSEEGIPADEAIEVPFQMPPPHERNWVPVQVAVIGAAGGVGLLLLTLFIVHTVRRQRRDPSDMM
ncbi:type VII secretion-associated serine protease mycosin [Actinophytocola gossypii]|uniref:Type VII secretion-associated serine protease mycosin n=1 Tax=Actinophytocola gossypii TaxID=2812003 RepID=A0ABT2JJ39_9PSEU|nr:type VII secretion-associated serine protease mycosin [Actinophytocola gossypii]MCT2587410.1 type VII secretion-associated serine protease mycosin [Actinophytocola gossypii]